MSVSACVKASSMLCATLIKLPFNTRVMTQFTRFGSARPIDSAVLRPSGQHRLG